MLDGLGHGKVEDCVSMVTGRLLIMLEMAATVIWMQPSTLSVGCTLCVKAAHSGSTCMGTLIVTCLFLRRAGLRAMNWELVYLSCRWVNVGPSVTLHAVFLSLLSDYPHFFTI